MTSLLADWRTLAVHEAIGRALTARDVDAFLACLTEDIVFENTSPAPDGERLVGLPAVSAFFKQL
ncbi:MAG TPA: nuclear transport factor 2 family protein, partial [Candidatus Dormibacteraeota bacterium]|nr:nuclear transport factor 2 family protein [Candidatus Dormibacteraeota bacterium]